MNYADPEAVPPVWEVGDVILDKYEVKEIFTGGGMGLVYRIYHRDWNIELAVKSPRAEYFETYTQKDNFIRECITWINLGLHPNIVNCHYVRNLGGIPRVFAEYVPSGSLKNCIESRELYEGGSEQALSRVLDIAIQMAWGLHYAHEEGLIHQDVKPANVLMGESWRAMVSDFGLAKARVATAENSISECRKDLFASYGGRTPAYCSPEQAHLAIQNQAGIPVEDQPKLTRGTDIWSWAVSVFEMFLGEPPCQYGQVAGEALDNYLSYRVEIEQSLPTMPEDVVTLLRHCFRHFVVLHGWKEPVCWGLCAPKPRTARRGRRSGGIWKRLSCGQRRKCWRSWRNRCR